jgi:hypothetical protein
MYGRARGHLGSAAEESVLWQQVVYWGQEQSSKEYIGELQLMPSESSLQVELDGSQEVEQTVGAHVLDPW